MPLFTGGTETDVGNERVHTFTSSGTLTVVSAGTVTYLIVGGGGGGGDGSGGAGAGGGGGGNVVSGSIVVSANQTITVGAAGAAGATSGGDGGTSSLGVIATAIGGGGGGAGVVAGRNGSSGGGGGGFTVTGGTGSSGGNGGTGPSNAGGGGGGDGGSGTNGAGDVGGTGGAGTSSSISGAAVVYAGGGGGGTFAGAAGAGGGSGSGGAGGVGAAAGTAGAANRGGGSGGGGAGGGQGPAGGAGVVIVRYVRESTITLTPATETDTAMPLTVANKVYAAATIAGVGGLTAAATMKKNGAVVLPGVGTLTGTGTLNPARGAATLTGVGALGATLPIPLIYVRPSADEILALDPGSRRQETIRFDLLDDGNRVIGELAVDQMEPPEITNDGNRRMRRQLSNLDLSPADLNDINTINDRVRPVWVLGEGGEGYEFPLGIFLFADASRIIRSFGTTMKATLHDQCLILDQPLVKEGSYSEGASVEAALREQVAAAGIVDATIDSTSATVGEPIGWASGRDSRLKTLESLCLLAGFLPPYFDNNGMLICRAHPDLSVAQPTLVYGSGNRVIDGSIVASDDLLSAPNVYIALDTGATDLPIVGIYSIPDDAPHSVANRGYEIPELVELQGLTDQAAADHAAEAAYTTGSSTFTWLSFDSTPDPRHDTFDIIEFDGLVYREQGWRLSCTAGSPMGHDARGTYQEGSL